MGEKRLIKHLSNGELDKVMRYMSYLIVEMGLGDNFQIAVRRETAGEWVEDETTTLNGALAAVEVHDQKFHADLFIGESWEGESDRIKATSLIHECLHILHHRVSLAVYEYLDTGLLPISMAGVAKSSYMREMEMLVDRITRTLEPRMYPWSKASELPLLPSVAPEGNHI